MKKLYVLLFVLGLSLSQGFSQQKAANTALNNYVHFTNESIHGLLIVHRLLENFNQDINKYVDLDGFQINFYSNKDLPKNIFEDPDNLFYKSASPESWMKKLQEDSANGNFPQSSEILPIAKKMNNICKAINNIRFEVEDYINGHDLTDSMQLQGVYNLLENGVKYYDDFFKTQMNLEEKITQLYSSSNTSSALYKNTLSFHKNAKEVMRALRAKQDNDLPIYIAEMKQAQPDIMRDILAKPNLRRVKKLEEKLKATISSSEAYFMTADVPKEYKLYKKFYFYHNSDIINKMNRYGNGYVTFLNEIFKSDSPNALLLFEEPHFYQVIYPEKLKTTEYIESSDDEITAIPEKLREREIITSKQKIVVDSLELDLHIYDHLIEDGDKVSINYNGDWLFEDHSLEAKPIKLKLKLNEKGKNYIIIHAVDIGYRPPNTSAINYTFGGAKKNIVMRSDLNASDLIEIVYQPNGE